MRTTNLWRRQDFTVNKFVSFLDNSRDIFRSMHISISALIVSFTTVKATPQDSFAPDVYVVFGVDKYPLRRSFYTWAEGAAPVAVFEFLSDSTAHQDRHEKVGVYLNDIGVQEYFIHQPEMEKPAEFRGWRRSPSGNIIEITPDAQGGLFSEALNLRLRWEEQQHSHVRLLRPYLPDGTPIATSMEERDMRVAAETRAQELEAELERLRDQLANLQNESG